jgi:hypothetical protein
MLGRDCFFWVRLLDISDGAAEMAGARVEADSLAPAFADMTSGCGKRGALVRYRRVSPLIALITEPY